MTRILLPSSTVLVLMLAGCGSKDFDAHAIEAAPVKLDAEQVTLAHEQVGCGVQNELWEAPTQVSPSRSTAKLTAKGRALKFDDDVVVTDTGYSIPYVQVRGEFPVAVLSVGDVKDGPEKDTKLAAVKLGVRIDSPCFAAPLPMMGLKNGNFSPDVAPMVLYRNYDGWKFEKFVR